MTFAEGVLRLVRSAGGVAAQEPDAPPAEAVDRSNPVSIASAAHAHPAAAAPAALLPVEAFTGQGLADIEAAVALVERGIAGRVILAGFQPWPGLLWQAYQLAEGADVLIIPTVAGIGGRIDIVVTRDPATASQKPPHG